MKTRILKWGNSLAVRIPKGYADELGLANSSPAEMTLEEGAIVLKPDRGRAWDLEELLDGVTDDNLHPPWGSETAASDEAEADSAAENGPSGGRSGPDGGDDR